MVIQIYIIHVLCYDTVKYCEGVKIVKKKHFQLQNRLFYSTSIVARPRRMFIYYIVLSESRLQFLNRFLRSSTIWNWYCFGSSFLVVLLNVCMVQCRWSDGPLVR